MRVDLRGVGFSMEAPVLYHCPLCGHEFAFNPGSCQSACPLGKHCNLVCCPNCHYSFPKDSKTVTLIKKIFKKRKGHVTPS